MSELPFHPAPKLMVTITDRSNSRRLEEIFREKQVRFHYMINAMGTASSKILKTFGLSGTEKTVCICLEPAMKIKPLMTAVVERLEFIHPGNGIAFTIPLSGMSILLSHTFDKELQRFKEGWDKWMEREMEKTKEDAHHELIVAVINQGFSDDLMDAAKKAGARGGTIIHARRTGLEDAVKFFGISLQAEKEIVAILTHHNQKKKLMLAISKACGTRTEARGIIFSLPVDICAGIDVEPI